MISTILFDFARVIIFPKDEGYSGELNNLHRSMISDSTYRFLGAFEFDDKLLNYIKKLKNKYEIYMFTSGIIQEVPEAKQKLAGIFKEIYSAEKLGIRKSEASSYIKVAELMGKRPEEILFIDDMERNVEAAKLAGMQGLVYKNQEELERVLGS